MNEAALLGPDLWEVAAPLAAGILLAMMGALLRPVSARRGVAPPDAARFRNLQARAAARRPPSPR